MSIEWRWRRFDVEAHSWAIPRPFVDYENQGPDFHIIAFGVRTLGVDPIVCVAINLGRAKR